MIKKSKFLLSLTGALLISAALPTSVAFAEQQGNTIEEGKKLAFTRSKGNCLACHMIKGGDSPGTIAPPLLMMKSRFPDKKVLKAQIWDASKRNPETSMPLFGRYEILTEDEINKVTDFIYSL